MPIGDRDTGIGGRGQTVPGSTGDRGTAGRRDGTIFGQGGTIIVAAGFEQLGQ